MRKVVEQEKLRKNDVFFEYQKQIIKSDKTQPSHEVIAKTIKEFGKDYRYQDSPHPVKELSNCKKDNTTIAR